MIQWKVKSLRCIMQRGVKSMTVAEIFPLHDAGGSKIFLLHFAAGRCDSLLHLAEGSKISPLHVAGGESNFTVAKCSRKILLPAASCIRKIAATNHWLDSPLHHAAERFEVLKWTLGHKGWISTNEQLNWIRQNKILDPKLFFADFFTKKKFWDI